MRHLAPQISMIRVLRDAKKLQFLMILLGNSRDLFLESGKCLHCKHYIFVGIKNNSDQYLIVVNYSID